MCAAGVGKEWCARSKVELFAAIRRDSSIRLPRALWWVMVDIVSFSYDDRARGVDLTPSLRGPAPAGPRDGEGESALTVAAGSGLFECHVAGERGHVEEACHDQAEQFQARGT